MSVITDSSRLEQAAAAFAGPGDRAALRTAVREAAAAADASDPQELYSLARYAIVAGDYETAHSLARRIPEHEGVRTVIEPILKPEPAARSAAALAVVRCTSGRSRAALPGELLHVPPRFPSDGRAERRAAPDRGRGPASARSESGLLGLCRPRDSCSFAPRSTWFEALKLWQSGNAAFNGRNYAVAQATYDACQAAICDYFGKYYLIDLGTGPLGARLNKLIAHLHQDQVFWGPLWARLRQRRALLTLQELSALDFPDPPRELYFERRVQSAAGRRRPAAEARSRARVHPEVLPARRVW